MMKMKLVLLAMVAAVFAGCATHWVDWNARVSTYTFDQAVMDYGPPDKQAKLSDGRKVVEWVSRYSGGGSTAIVSGGWGYPGSVGFVQTTGPLYYEYKLRLTFTTNNVLSAWSKN
jgi:hypothetical protein